MSGWYRFCRALFRIYFRLYHRGRILHAERVPPEGPCLLAANHVSFLDPPFVGLCCDREGFYLARDTLFQNPLTGWLLRSWNCVPVKREGGDLGGLRMILRLLREGKAVLMFPEGTRSPDGQLQPARAGIGMIVARTRSPIVPVRVFGTDNAMPRGVSLPRPAQVTIVFGEPFVYPMPADFEELPAERQKALYQAIGDEVMRRIAALQREVRILTPPP